MDNSKRAFFELVRAGLFPVHGEDLRVLGQTRRQSRANDSLFKGVVWEKVYKLAQEQSVQGLVLQGIEWFKTHNDNPNIFETCGTSEKARANIDIQQELLLQWIGEVQVIEQQNKEMNAFVAGLIEKLRKMMYILYS